MSKIFKDNAETIGGTPLVRINHISTGNVYAKLENRNPAMSVKCRIGSSMVMSAEQDVCLKPGMTKSQVRFALGTPLVSDVFHPNRWDYVYRFQKAGVLTEQHHVTVVFENDLLKRVEGDVVPASSDKPGTVAPAAEDKPAAKAE